MTWTDHICGGELTKGPGDFAPPEDPDEQLWDLAEGRASDTLQRARQGWTHDADIREAAERVAEDAIDEDLAVWLVAASRFNQDLEARLLEALTDIHFERLKEDQR